MIFSMCFLFGGPRDENYGAAPLLEEIITQKGSRKARQMTSQGDEKPGPEAR